MQQPNFTPKKEKQLYLKIGLSQEDVRNETATELDGIDFRNMRYGQDVI